MCFSQIIVQTVRISYRASTFHGLSLPEQGIIVGYGAILHSYALNVPVPQPIALISDKNRKYDIAEWRVFSPRYLPEENLYKHLSFAMKYEGINLLILKKLFQKLPDKQITQLVQSEPAGQYSRRIWFLYEWLMDDLLDIPDADKKIKYTPLGDDKIQYTIEEGKKSSRHRVINNLLGTKEFCPYVLKTETLKDYTNKNLHTEQRQYQERYSKSLLQRASSFLLLKDSKASFAIEGESPRSKRMTRWGKAIGKAGKNNLTKSELERLQGIVIENHKHIDMGFRKKGGFIGEHDADTYEPIPEHISAKWEDLDDLVNGLIETNDKLIKDEIDAVAAAAIIAFGFVFIHPFEDGNGRVHRYLIHHVLAKKQFSHQGLIFPVSASILNQIDDYRIVLESYSHPLLEYIEWRTNKKHNVEVLNETSAYYRYFDATKQVEFLYKCVLDTIENIIPVEIDYLRKYDEFKSIIEDEIGLPDMKISLLSKLLLQNRGTLSKKKLKNDFPTLDPIEVEKIESTYKDIFQE